MIGCQTTEINSVNNKDFPKQEHNGLAIRLIFTEEPNREAPALIGQLLRKSYFNHISSESEREQ